MFESLSAILHHLWASPIGMLFVVIALGSLVGQIPFGGFRLGGSAVLFVALIFGHFGVELPKEIQTLGVILFVYSVGLQAGPQIVSSFKKSKGQYLAICLCVIISAGGVGILFNKVFGLPKEMIVGLYSGALTSTPALAAAMETLGNSTPSVGYGLAYPFGIFGVILLVQLAPVILKVNLKKEETIFKQQLKTQAIMRKAFRVTNANLNGKNVDDLMQENPQFTIARIRRGEDVFTPDPETDLRVDDVVLIVAEEKTVKGLNVLFGEPVPEIMPRTDRSNSRWLTISAKSFVGKELRYMEIPYMFGLIPTRIRRGGVEFIPRPGIVLEAGDEIRVSGTSEDIARFAKLVARDPETLHQTDIFSFSLGLALSVLVGLIKIPLTEKLVLSLGIAGGPLVVGMAFGYWGRFGRVVGHMPKAARYLVGEIGLYLFLAVAGCASGGSFVQTLSTGGLMLLLCGALMTATAVIASILMARLVFRMNMLMVLGAVCGGMTSTPSLGVITSQTQSEIPALGYTGIYPMAVLFTTLTVQILVLI